MYCIDGLIELSRLMGSSILLCKSDKYVSMDRFYSAALYGFYVMTVMDCSLSDIAAHEYLYMRLTQALIILLLTAKKSEITS